MVNVGLNFATILGIILAIAGVCLLLLPLVKSEKRRKSDFVISMIALISGFLLVFQGWRLDPILQLGQILIIIIVIFYTVENIILRR